jgi:hypothetical protein
VSGPAASTATRNKVLGAPLSALGLAFARLPEGEQARHTGVLLALVGPLLGHLSDKALRKKLLQVGFVFGWCAQLSACVVLQCCLGCRQGSCLVKVVMCPLYFCKVLIFWQTTSTHFVSRVACSCCVLCVCSGAA